MSPDPRDSFDPNDMSENPLDYFRNLSPDDVSGDQTNELFDQNGMCVERYDELMNNPELKLTEGELRVGWYWSPAWDGMLVHKSWDEARFDYPTQEEMP